MSASKQILMSASKQTHNRNDSSNLIGIPLANALRSMSPSGRDSYIKRTLNPSVNDLKETLVLREKEKEQIIEKTELKWGPFFSHVKTKKDFNNLVEAMAKDVKRDTKSVDAKIEYIQKQLNGRGVVAAKSAKIDKENPQGKKSKSFSGFLRLLSLKREPARTSITSLNKPYTSNSSNKSSGTINKILRSKIKYTKLASPTSPSPTRSRLANLKN